MSDILHAFAHLFIRITIQWIKFLGTSPFGIVATIATLVVAEAIGLTGKWWRMEVWKQIFSSGGLRRALKGLLWVWGFAFLVCIITTVYDDHVALKASNASLRSANDRLRDSNLKLGSERDDWKRKSENNPAEKQTGSMPSEKTAGVPKGQPVRVSGSINWIDPDVKKGKYAKALILVSNQNIIHTRFAIKCNRDFNEVDASIWNAGVQTGGARKIGSRQAFIDIGLPAWEAMSPLVIRFYFDDMALETCTITPQ